MIVPHVTSNCQKKVMNNQNKMMNSQDKMLEGTEKIFVEVSNSNGTNNHKNCSLSGWWPDSIGSNCYHISPHPLTWGSSKDKYQL